VKHLRFDEEAEAEFLEAADVYDADNRAVAWRFVKAVLDAIEVVHERSKRHGSGTCPMADLCRHPELAPICRRARRTPLLFPHPARLATALGLRTRHTPCTHSPRGGP
jgi:hypothetical protein